jgi:carotenoid cleavage dioxygenase-like enzyme
VDPVSNKLFFSGYSITDEKELKIGAFDGPELSPYYGLDLPVKSWVHDTLMTENYLLLVESSVHFSGVEGILRGVLFDFDAAHRFRVGVVPKAAASGAEAQNSTAWFEAEAALAFVHGMNAWESGDVITIVTPLAKVGMHSGLTHNQSLPPSVPDSWSMGGQKIPLRGGWELLKIASGASIKSVGTSRKVSSSL